MPAAYGLTVAGFVVKPLVQILSDMQNNVWSAPSIGPELDLSPQTPDGQMLGIYANDISSVWELLQEVYNVLNPTAAEGASADNVGDLRGVPREGASYTQVYCTLVFGSGPSYPVTFAGVVGTTPGALVANVSGLPAQTFSNLSSLTVTGPGTVTGVLFQATQIGPTPAVNQNTLNAITTPVTGWTSVNNPAGQSQAGTSQETDANYLPRQEAEIAAEGSCNPSATVAAIEQLGAAQTPPVTLTATVYSNTTEPPVPVTIGSVTVQPNQFAVFVYDGGTGWLSVGANQQLVGQTIWDNNPTGNLAVGTITVTIQDPVLGQLAISFNEPTGEPLFISATFAIRPGFVFATVAAGVRAALVAAAVAPTLASGVAPAGQLTPGTAVIGSQLQAVIMGVPGVLDVQALTFGLASSPVNTAPIAIPINEVATILQGTVATNVVLTQGAPP